MGQAPWLLKSLSSAQALTSCPSSLCSSSRCLQDIDHSRLVLTPTAQACLGLGSPEAQVFAAVPPEGITLADIKARLGELGEIGFRQAMQLRLVGIDKSGGGEPRVVRKAEGPLADRVLEVITAVAEGKVGGWAVGGLCCGRVCCAQTRPSRAWATLSLRRAVQSVLRLPLTISAVGKK